MIFGIAVVAADVCAATVVDGATEPVVAADATDSGNVTTADITEDAAKGDVTACEENPPLGVTDCIDDATGSVDERSVLPPVTDGLL